MAYKKYIERNGKLYGPYLYESKRVDGKVVSSYHGRKNKVPLLPTVVPHHSHHNRKTKKFFQFLIPLAIITLLLIFVVPKLNPTGKVTMDLQGNYMEGQILSGQLDIKLKQGELLPADTKIIIKNNNNTQEFLLNKLTNAQLSLGEFYIEGTEISGQGEGYGVEGANIQAEQVYFKLNSTIETEEQIIEPPTEINDTSNTTSQENQTQSDNSTEIIPENQTNEIIPEENTTEVPTEEITPEVSQPISESPVEPTTTEEQPESIPASNEIPVEEPQTETITQTTTETATEAPITGNLIKNILGGVSKFFLSLSPTGNVVSSTEEISKDLTYPEKINYNLKTGETIKLVPGSVTTLTQPLDDSYIQLEKSGDTVIITTSYYNSTSGFGKDYIKDQIVSFPIDLTSLNLQLEKGSLEISLVYSDTEIDSIKTRLDENMTIGITEKPIIEENVSLAPEQNVTVPEETKLQKLTDTEKRTLLDRFGNATIKQEAKAYREWIIVKLSLGSYSIEHSYQSTLNSTELEYYIERDKINWLKDIAYTLEETKSTSTPLTNYSKSENLF